MLHVPILAFFVMRVVFQVHGWRLAGAQYVAGRR